MKKNKQKDIKKIIAIYISPSFKGTVPLTSLFSPWFVPQFFSASVTVSNITIMDAVCNLRCNESRMLKYL